MAFPGNNVKRRNRRNFGRHQGGAVNGVTVTATPSGSTVVLNYSSPVNVAGNPALTVATLTIVSKVVNSPTQITVTMSGAVATHAWAVAANDPNVTSYYGGPTLGASGTF